MLIPCLDYTKSVPVLVSPGMGSSTYLLQVLSLEWVPSILRKYPQTLTQKDPLGPWPMIIFPPSSLLLKICKSFLLGEKKIRKAEPGSMFFTQPVRGFQRAWNAINTNVKSAVVPYEVIQCYCYLTYKQLLPTNVNCHWNLELLYTSEINLPFRLARYRILSSPALNPRQSPAMQSYSHMSHFLYAISLFLLFPPEVLLY